MTTVQFTLNGELVSVDLAEARCSTLAEYLRFKTALTGTKLGCGQGGCGACTVAIARGTDGPRAAPSCLTPLASVHGAAVITVEGLQASSGEPHPISERLAKFNGSQCGFCTPGMVMRLYTELSRKDGGKAVKEADLERCIDGNICRCTGYRPIVECAKSFASDTTVTNQLDTTVSVGPYDVARDPRIVLPTQPEPLQGPTWRRPTSLAELRTELRQAEPRTLVAGGTGSGIYYELGVSRVQGVLVDVTGVPELKGVQVTASKVVIGATETWASVVDALATLPADLPPAFAGALQVMRERCNSIAGAQVRSSGTLGGNIALTRNKTFWSDWVPMLAALGARVAGFAGDKEFEADLLDFVREEEPFAGLLVSVTIPAPPEGSLFRSYRVSKRGRNAYALANAAFLAVRAADGHILSASLVFGGEMQKPLRLPGTAAALQGISSQDAQANPDQVAAALGKAVQDDVEAARVPSPKMKVQLARAFIIKYLSALFAEVLPAPWRSADLCVHDVARHTSAEQHVPVPVNLGGPLNMPCTKTTAVEQTTGKAKFVDDMPRPQGMLMAALVLCPEANVVVGPIDPAPAKAVLGDKFRALLTAADLKSAVLDWKKCGGGAELMTSGKPDFKPDYQIEDFLLLPAGEPSRFGGQPVALLLAQCDSPKVLEHAAAMCAANLVLERKGPAVIGGLEGGPEICVEPVVLKRGKPVDQFLTAAAGSSQYVEGRFEKKSQQHFYMEPQSVICSPDEGGISIYVAAQGTEYLQRTVSTHLGLPQSKIAIKYRRVGGGFGGKMMRPAWMAALAAEAALKVSLPVRLVLSREVDMQIVGGRQEIEAKWRAAVQPNGKITALEYKVWMAHGAGTDSQRLNAQMMGGAIDMVYGIPNMQVTVNFIRQHVQCRTAVRAPGHCEATQMIEAVFNGVGAHLGLSMTTVREANFYNSRFSMAGLAGGMAPQMPLDHYSHLTLWDNLKARAKYDERAAAVKAFNEANRWKKRGLSMVPARYGVASMPGQAARVDIFADGSVQISVTGSEIGQGLHTKVGQLVCTAFTRGLGAGPPLGVIRFLETSTEQIPNGGITGGSTTSECTCYAAESAVDQLLPRLQGYKKAALKRATKHPDGLWFDIVQEVFNTKLMGMIPITPFLTATGVYYPYIHQMSYDTFGGAVAEVELDVLTGESRTLFSHVMFDSGKSMNPMIDVGQLEGAFMMGLGHSLLEGMDYDKATGRCLTDNTWTYKPPLASDIPERFVVELVDLEKSRLHHPIANCMPLVGKMLNAVGTPWKATKGKSIYKSAKAIGEPPLLLSTAVHSALQAAVVAARGRPLDGHMLPVPANSKALLPLLQEVAPGQGKEPSKADSMDVSVSTAASTA